MFVESVAAWLFAALRLVDKLLTLLLVVLRPVDSELTALLAVLRPVDSEFAAILAVLRPTDSKFVVPSPLDMLATALLTVLRLPEKPPTALFAALRLSDTLPTPVSTPDSTVERAAAEVETEFNAGDSVLTAPWVVLSPEERLVTWLTIVLAELERLLTLAVVVLTLVDRPDTVLLSEPTPMASAAAVVETEPSPVESVERPELWDDESDVTPVEIETDSELRFKSLLLMDAPIPFAIEAELAMELPSVLATVDRLCDMELNAVDSEFRPGAGSFVSCVLNEFTMVEALEDSDVQRPGIGAIAVDNVVILEEVDIETLWSAVETDVDTEKSWLPLIASRLPPTIAPLLTFVNLLPENEITLELKVSVLFATSPIWMVL
ncbi:protein of unknown function [Caballeronia sp. S22]